MSFMYRSSPTSKATADLVRPAATLAREHAASTEANRRATAAVDPEPQAGGGNVAMDASSAVTDPDLFDPSLRKIRADLAAAYRVL